MADVCQSCGSWDTQGNCQFCSVRLCSKCRTNHEGACKELTHRKSLGLGPTIRNAGTTRNVYQGTFTNDDLVGAERKLTESEAHKVTDTYKQTLKKIIDEYKQTLATESEIQQQEKTNGDSLPVCDSGGSTEGGVVLPEAPDEHGTPDGVTGTSAAEARAIPEVAGEAIDAVSDGDYIAFADSQPIASIVLGSSQVVTVPAVLGAPYGETNATAESNPSPDIDAGTGIASGPTDGADGGSIENAKSGNPS